MEVQWPVTTKSHTGEAGASAKGKEVYSGATQPGRMLDSHLKHHLNLPAQTEGYYKYREGRTFFLIQLSF